MTFKQKVLTQHQQLIQDKIDVFRDRIAELALDAQNDAKSSAGDKHETALSMMQLEQEKLNAKLAEYITQKALLDKINPEFSSDRIALGSLVQANKMWLFLSAALPKIIVDEKTVIAVSLQSPLGQALLGQTIGFSFEINKTQYLIEDCQ